MAIIKRSDADVAPSPGLAEGAIAVEEAPAGPAADSAPPAPPGAVKSMAQTLPAALEPELRRIIDTAVARVAAIELEAIREARELTQRSEQEAREALRFALDRAFNLINTLELLAATVGGMAEALKVELDDAIDALRKVPEPESALAREMTKTPPPQAAPPQEAPPPEPEPTPEPPPAAAQAPPALAPQPAVAPAEPETQPVTAEETASAEEPVAAEPVAEEPVAEHPAPEEPAVQEPAREEVPAAEARTNGYPPAERQAESLAVASGSEPESETETEPEPERTVVRAPASQDGGMVTARRRGLIRRLFAK